MPKQVVAPSEAPKYDGKFWQGEFEAANKRLRDFRKNGNAANERYINTPHDKEMSDYAGNKAYRLNLYYANTSTMIDMLYGATPKVEVSRRYSDPHDDVARMAAVLMERLLTEGVDAKDKRFGPKIRGALQDRLIPGLGAVKWRYEFTEDGNETAENVELDYHHWKDCRWAYANTWDDVWWFSFDHRLTFQEVQAKWGKDVARQLEYSQADPSGNDPDNKSDEYGTDNKDTRETAVIVEVYCKRTRTIYWVAQDGDLGVLSSSKPEWTKALKDFFPFPPPMMANTTTTTYLPTPDWWLAQDLYQEIDTLNTRLHYMIKAMRLRGGYDQTVPELAQLLNQGDNQLIGVDMGALSERGGLKKAIEFVPLEMLAAAIGALRQELDAKVAQLDSITGMSGMMRGDSPESRVSAAREHYQSKYGSIKIQSKQDVFEEFVSSALEVRAEIISAMYSPESIIEQSNAMFLLEMKPPPPQPQPPQPTGNPEQDQQMMQQAQQAMQEWQAKAATYQKAQARLSAAIKLIKDSKANAWRVKVQPQSLAMTDRAMLKQERSDALTALGTYTQAMAGMVTNAPEVGPMMIQLLGWGLQGFRGSDEIEGIVDNMAEAYEAGQKKRDAEPKDDPGTQALQVQQMKGEQAMQQIMAKTQADMQKTQAEMQADAQKSREQAMFEMKRFMQESLVEMKMGMQELMAEYGLKKELETHKAQLEAGAETNKQEMQAEYNTREKLAEAVINEEHPDPVKVADLEVKRDAARNRAQPGES